MSNVPNELDESASERARDVYGDLTDDEDVAIYSAAVDLNETKSLMDERLNLTDNQVNTFEEIRKEILGPEGAHRHIPQAVNDLDFRYPTEVADRAHRLINEQTNFYENGFIADPSKEDHQLRSFATGAIYASALLNNDKKSQRVVSNAFDTSEGVVSDTYEILIDRF